MILKGDNTVSIDGVVGYGFHTFNGSLTLAGDGSLGIRIENSSYDGIWSTSGVTVDMDGALTVDIDVNHEGSGIVTSGGDLVCSGSGDVTIKTNYYGVGISGNVIFSGSGAVSITGGYYAVLLDDLNDKVLLNGSENPISLKSTEDDCEAVINNVTKGSQVEGDNFENYDVTGAPNESSVVYTKKPGPVMYTVTFDMNGHGTVPNDQTIAEGGNATRPTTDPTAEGWIFVGWYADATFNAAFDFNTAINADTTVYAKWTENSVTPADPTAPQTGDSSNMLLWVLLLAVSGATLTGTTIYSKKKKYKAK